MITTSVRGSCVGTNNVNAVDNSVTHQTTYNHTVTPAVRVTSSSGFIKGAKGRLPLIKYQLDEVLIELQFISEQGYDEDQYSDLVLLHARASASYYQLKAGTKGFVQSLVNSGNAKQLKEEVRSLHDTVMHASEATKREMAQQRIAAQRATLNLAPPEPSPHPCCPHPCQPQVVININIYGQP